jgi:hypothetical protein
LDDTYDWEGRLMDQDEEHLYHAIQKLWHVGKVSLEKLKFLPEVYVEMMQLEKNINYFF